MRPNTGCAPARRLRLASARPIARSPPTPPQPSIRLGETLDGRRAGSLTWHSRHVPLKVRRRPISQGRVHPFAVVVISHEFLDMFGEFLEIPILVAVDLFLLQRFHEAFIARHSRNQM